jgi:hypothetical protein
MKMISSVGVRNYWISMVDAGMRQLNETGYMHNRVRMVVASFLCKHLLINWQWEKLILLKSYWIMKCHLMWAMAMGSRNRL